MLRENADLLAPHIDVLLKDAFEDLTEKARSFSLDPREKTLSQVAKAAIGFFSGLNKSDARPLLLSSEDLAGHMPGRHGLDCYDSTGLVMKCISVSAYAYFGKDTDLTFYFSTRDTDSWLRSTWWQNLRSTRLTLDFDDYCARFDGARTLQEILQEIEKDVAPARVVSCALEDVADRPLGPLDPVLELFDLPGLDRSALSVLPPENVQPDVGIDTVFLALNRSRLPEKDVQDAKRSIRKMARRLED